MIPKILWLINFIFSFLRKFFFRFDFMAISDNRQKVMPSDADRNINNGIAAPLAYKEAVRLMNPQNHTLKGQV